MRLPLGFGHKLRFAAIAMPLVVRSCGLPLALAPGIQACEWPAGTASRTRCPPSRRSQLPVFVVFSGRAMPLSRPNSCIQCGVLKPSKCARTLGASAFVGRTRRSTWVQGIVHFKFVWRAQSQASCPTFLRWVLYLRMRLEVRRAVTDIHKPLFSKATHVLNSNSSRHSQFCRSLHCFFSAFLLTHSKDQC